MADSTMGDAASLREKSRLKQIVSQDLIAAWLALTTTFCFLLLIAALLWVSWLGSGKLPTNTLAEVTPAAPGAVALPAAAVGTPLNTKTTPAAPGAVAPPAAAVGPPLNTEAPPPAPGGGAGPASTTTPAAGAVAAVTPGPFHDLLNTLVGIIGTGWATIIGYYFGSSTGSQQKTEALSQVALHNPQPNPNPPPPHNPQPNPNQPNPNAPRGPGG